MNYYSAVKAGAAGFGYDYSGLVLSQGPVEGLSGLMMNASGSSVDLVWDGNGVLGGAGDVVSVVLLNGDRMEMRFLKGVALRGDGGVSVAVPMGWNGEGVAHLGIDIWKSYRKDEVVWFGLDQVLHLHRINGFMVLEHWQWHS